MYLKSLEIKKFRKFGVDNGLIEFVDSKENLMTPEDINVAKTISLIVGKNNSGKTTVITALNKIVNEPNFIANDFNFIYLNRLIEQYKNGNYDEIPYLSFKIVIGIDERNHNDIVNNFVPFITLEDLSQPDEKKDFTIILKYELKEDELFKTSVKELIESIQDNDSLLFNKFLSLLNTKDIFALNYYNENDEIVKTNFNIKNLIDIAIINPNENQGEKDLSKIFSKIIRYKYGKEDNAVANIFKSKIEEFNKDMSDELETNVTPDINSVINKLQDKNTLQAYLSSDLSFEQLLEQLIKYQYKENTLYIPENQFGLGYRNLMRIIGELIDYVEQYPEGDKHSKLNVICIEEPEVFMHPQMQELFIYHIKEAIDTLLSNSEKKLNSQLLISTHSAHILNSKIHTSNSFDHINYIYENENLSNVVNLKDSNAILDAKLEGETDEVKEKRIKEELNFIKKHIKFKASELFFSDAIIFVEGITEEVLLSYYVGLDTKLNKKYITIFNIDGAHGLVYHHLIKLLNVPTIIITDLDIKRTEEEKKDYTQIDSLADKKTTNNTIIKYNTTNDISSLSTNHFIDANLYIAFQGDKTEDVYATSLEESFILNNYDNELLNNALYKSKRNTYLEIVGEDKEKQNLVARSYELQRKLSDSKSKFANELLYQLSNEEENLPTLPKYIEDSLTWLKNELGLSTEEEE